MNHCTICRSELDSALRISPQDHERKHGDDERACGQCWEAYLSLQIEEQRPDEIECLFCKSHMSEADIMGFARTATTVRYDICTNLKSQNCSLTRPRYSFKKLLKGYVCMSRCKKSLQGTQSYNRELDGRVFTCTHCRFQACIDCDRPEHAHESCAEYRKRQEATHGRAEALTHKAFKSCPGCDATIQPRKPNCHTQCESCGYQFCSKCMIPWVGEGSALLVGKEAHSVGCKYRTRDAESKHSLPNRWVQTDEVQQRLDQKEDRKRARDEQKKRSRTEEDLEKAVDGMATRKPKKKKRAVKKAPKMVAG
jgi:hypothetical protein